MKNQIVTAFKNQTVVALIVVGAIILATPIFIFGIVRVVWELGTSFWTVRGRPVSQEKIKHLLEAIETHIGPQTDKRNKIDGPG
jgi:hypothetical protein